MGDLDNDDMGFENTNDSILNCSSTNGNGVINTNPSCPPKISANLMMGTSVSANKSSLGVDSFFVSGWDPLLSLGQNENFGVVSHGGFSSSYPVMLENQGQGGSGTTQVVQYPSDQSYVDMVTKLPCFGSGNYSDMFGSFGLLPECGQIPTNYRNRVTSELASTAAAQTLDNQQVSGDEEPARSPDGKSRKRALDKTFPFSPNKKSEAKLKKDLSGDSSNMQEEKKPETEQNLGGNSRGKATGKQTKENSNSGEAPKDNYIHVRARRGQATNSHSLAERVRREKISERMRLLQELVPGCNKITGKAVMLDEIINYVQSLQQQVEFLSMKLATVNPDMNVDLERILSKDIFHGRGSSGNALGFDPNMTSAHPVPHRMFQFPGTMSNLPTTSTQFPPLPQQTMLESDLQNLFQMGYDSSMAIENLGQNGRLKSEL